MAVTRGGSVVRVDTIGSETLLDVKSISGIKWLPAGTSPEITIRDKDGSGSIIYNEAVAAAGTSNFEEIKAQCKDGIHITLVGASSVAFIYTDA